MSERHRQTQRASRREDKRHTMRVSRFMQVGGGQLFMIPTPRIENWNKAFAKHPDPVIKGLDGKLNQENWGATDINDKINLYVSIVERQDDLFLVAISIINAQLKINSDAEDLEEEVLRKIKEANLSDNGEAYKEYLLDVYRLVTGQDPIKYVSNLSVIIMKHTRLFNDPLSNILMWPKRATNMFIYCIAKSMVDMKLDTTMLERVKANPDLYRMFADIYDTFIHQDTLYNTKKSLRDGFYITQKLYSSIIPLDECAYESVTSCEKTHISRSFWEEFCYYFNSSESTLFETKTGILKLKFSHIFAEIFKLYKNNKSIKEVRDAIIAKFGAPINPSTGGAGTIYRIDAIKAQAATSRVANMMRALDPEQYTFIFHLLYTIEKIETEGAT
jgi:hypothetical protein